MFDIALRPLKDSFFNPISRSVPHHITPLHITTTAFVSGLISCFLACARYRAISLLFWVVNRALDCLDGAVARHRRQQSDLGGFLDLLADFIVYALIPISCACGNSWIGGASRDQTAGDLLIVALLEASFWLNNFVLFYIAALVEKRNTQGLQRGKDEATTLAMSPTLVEGLESSVFFTLMLVMPDFVGPLSSMMFLGVVLGTWQRVHWLVTALSQAEKMD